MQTMLDEVRKERYDRDCVVRKFSKGEMVMTRLPGLQCNLKEHEKGPEMLDVPSEFHVVLGVPGKMEPFHAMQVA